MTPRILAIDPSLTSTGICRPDGTTTAVRSKLTGPARLDDILTAVMAQADFDLAVIEHYSFGSKNKGEFLGELGGVIRHHLWNTGIPYVEIAPTLLKKYATGRGNASKDQVLTQTAATTGIAFATSDECDAWVLWRMARDHYSGFDMHRARTDVLARIDWPNLEAAA